jgi:uncharacterized SAM-binding protein YcdF (DUF218 family)
MSNLLHALLLPPGIVLALLVFIIIITPILTRRTCIFFGLLLITTFLYLLSTTIVSKKIVSRLQNQYQPLASLPTAPANLQAVVVQLEEKFINDPQHKDKTTLPGCALEKLRYGVRLAKTLNQPLVIGFVGDNVMVDSLKDILWEFNFLQPNFIVNAETKTASVDKINNKLKEYNFNNVAVVSVAISAPRVMRNFKTLTQAVAVPVGFIEWSNTETPQEQWLPTYKNLFYSSMALQEYLLMFWEL